MTLAVNRQRLAATGLAASGTSALPPRLADGVTLLGAYEGSGYKQPHYLARRKAGNVVQLTELLFLVAEACDGRRTTEQIAALVSERYGKTLTSDNVETLLDKLRPLGVITAPDGASPEVPAPDPLLALRWRISLVGRGAVHAITRPFRWLFHAPVVAAVCVGVLATDWWLFFQHGLAQPIRQTIEDPVTFLLVAALVISSAAFHEIGHATACVYSGGHPGRMGAGIYLAWPAFYTDVTDAYRLPRSGRLRTDLGGIYFNAVFVLAVVATFAGTGFEPLLLVAFLLQVEIVQQLLPFLRLDGYYVLADIAGVPDLFRRIPAVLRSVNPLRKADRRVTELKLWVRALVIAWTVIVVPLLLVNLVLAIVFAPRILATAWHSGARLIYAFEHASGALKAADALQLAFLTLPVIGLALTFVRLGRRSSAAAWRWSSGRPARRGLVAGAGFAALLAIAMAWWPDGRMTPLRPGERGTLTDQVRSLENVGVGHPLLMNPQQAGTQPLPKVGDATKTSPGQPQPAPSASASPSASATPSSTPTTAAGTTGTTQPVSPQPSSANPDSASPESASPSPTSPQPSDSGTPSSPPASESPSPSPT
jgi:putative peptide zinc metalloprotease protein